MKKVFKVIIAMIAAVVSVIGMLYVSLAIADWHDSKERYMRC